jgi:hypothetical protein
VAVADRRLDAPAEPPVNGADQVAGHDASSRRGGAHVAPFVVASVVDGEASDLTLLR